MFKIYDCEFIWWKQRVKLHKELLSPAESDLPDIIADMAFLEKVISTRLCIDVILFVK